MNIFHQASKAHAIEKLGGVVYLVLSVLFMFTTITFALPNNHESAFIFGLITSLLFLVWGIRSLRSNRLLKISDTVISMEGDFFSTYDWMLPWKSLIHVQLVTLVIGNKREKILYLYSIGTIRPLYIRQTQFDEFQEIVKLVEERMAIAGYSVEKIEKN